MKALSVHQPHASRIAAGVKTLEVRSRRTRHRGPLLICATARPKLDNLPTGVAVCIVDITDCRLMTPDDATAACVPFHPGHYVWQLANPRPAPPIRVRGQQSLFTVQIEAATRIAG